MARYKHIDTSPRFLAVDLQRHLLPGIFEHAMNHWIELGGYRYATNLDPNVRLTKLNNAIAQA